MYVQGLAIFPKRKPLSPHEVILDRISETLCRWFMINKEVTFYLKIEANPFFIAVYSWPRWPWSKKIIHFSLLGEAAKKLYFIRPYTQMSILISCFSSLMAIFFSKISFKKVIFLGGPALTPQATKKIT